MPRTAALCTATHVLKGAAARVLGLPTGASTVSVAFDKKRDNRAKLTLDLNLAAGATAIEPNAAQVATVEATTNAVIAHDVPVHMEAMDRARATELYGNSMLDAFPLPAHVTEVTVLTIPAPEAEPDCPLLGANSGTTAHVEDPEGLWNVNCCPGEHLPSTAGVGSVEITSHNWNGNKGHLRLHYTIHPNR